MNADVQERIVSSIVNKMDPRVIERVPTRVLLMVFADYIGMNPHLKALLIIASNLPDEKEESVRLYAKTANQMLIIAWESMHKSGLVDEDVPAELRKMIEP